MALITLMNAQLAFGHVALLDHATFALESNERVGLIGRNGAGKSSLLKILGGLAHADDGTLSVQQGLRITYVAQEPDLQPEDTVFQSAARGLGEAIALRERGLLLAGVDVIGDCVTEINVTSPTCFQEIFDQTGCDVAALFIDALESALSTA